MRTLPLNPTNKMKTPNWKPSEKETPKGDATPIRFVLDEPTPPCPEITQELLDNPAFKMLSCYNPVVYTAPCLDAPADVWDAAETLHNYFTKNGQREWQLMHVASRKIVAKLEQEKSELFDACLAFRTALKDLDKALGDCLEVPANVLPAWYAAGLLLENTPKP